jgi:hypothetical protein
MADQIIITDDEPKVVKEKEVVVVKPEPVKTEKVVEKTIVKEVKVD